MTDKKPNAGTCGICLGLWMLDKAGNLVHHGYQRPGDGWQTDGCPGVKKPPYEKSTLALEEYVALLDPLLDDRRAVLARLESRPETVPNMLICLAPNQFVRPQIGPEHYAYKRSLTKMIKKVKRDIRDLERERQKCQTRIEEWEERPLRYKSNEKPTPKVDLIKVGQKYKVGKNGPSVIAREKGLPIGQGYDGVRVEFHNGKERTVRARVLIQMSE